MKILLRVDGLTVSYGGIMAVQGISFDVNEGEIVAILGANGAGKTSSLLAIAGSVITSGAIEFQGKRIETLSPAERVAKGVVLCPEGRRIFPYLTVKENLLAGAYRIHDRSAIDATLERSLSMFPILRERLDQPGRTLSGGEQQMLAIARALMSQPALLLLDEPSLGLAPIVSQTIYSTIFSLRETGVSILLVEQNAKAALKLADRAYLMETGSIVRSGIASELATDDQVKMAYLGG